MAQIVYKKTELRDNEEIFDYFYKSVIGNEESYELKTFLITSG